MTLAERAAQGCPECEGSGLVFSGDYRPDGTPIDDTCPTCQHTIAVAEVWAKEQVKVFAEKFKKAMEGHD